MDLESKNHSGLSVIYGAYPVYSGMTRQSGGIKRSSRYLAGIQPIFEFSS